MMSDRDREIQTIETNIDTLCKEIEGLKEIHQKEKGYGVITYVPIYRKMKKKTVCLVDLDSDVQALLKHKRSKLKSLQKELEKL